MIQMRKKPAYILLIILVLLICTSLIYLLTQPKYSEDEIMKILKTDNDLNRFIASNEVILNMTELSSQDIIEQQKRDDAFGQWYNKIEPADYLQVKVTSVTTGQAFLAIIDKEQKNVVRILGLFGG